MSKDKLNKAADELLRKDGFFKKRDSRPKSTANAEDHQKSRKRVDSTLFFCYSTTTTNKKTPQKTNITAYK